MDCTQFENIVHEIERPGTEGFALGESALAHAESCSKCARLMTEAESLDAGLRAMMAAAAMQKAPPSVEALLMAELRRNRAAYLRSRVRRQVAALSTAAVALLAVGLWPRHRAVQPIGAAKTAELVQAPGSPGVPAISAAAGALAQDLTTEINAGDSEYATSFVPLPYADDPSAIDDGAVVRVEMPRAALASFGLPVAAMESGGTVRADLIVSADGTPQAIRLVPQDRASRE
jgi:hypothetical protein